MNKLFKSSKTTPLFWGLDETSGTRFESSGSGFDLTDTHDNVYYTDGISSTNAANFTDTPSHLFANLGVFSSFSFSFWVKGDVQPQPYAELINNAGSFEVTFGHQPETTSNLHSYFAGGEIIGTTTITDLNWHHVVLTYDGTYYNLYCDTTLQGQINAIDIVTDLTNLTFGGSGDDNSALQFIGAMDAILFCEYALTQNEINALYNNGTGTQDPTVVNINNSKIIINNATYILPTSGLLAFYNFDDTNWYDSSGNNNNLTFQGSNPVTNVTGVSGNAANFDGTNRLYTTNFGVNVNGNFTVSCWFNSNILSGHILGAPFENGFFVGGDGIGLEMGLVNRNDPTPYVIKTGPLDLHKWYHLACIRNGNDLRLYVNGILKDFMTIPDGYNFDGASILSVGGGEFNEYFYQGSIDALGIWNIALTPKDINYLYANGNGRQIPFSHDHNNSRIISQ